MKPRSVGWEWATPWDASRCRAVAKTARLTVKSDVVELARFRWAGLWWAGIGGGFAGLIGEDSEKAPIAGVEIELAAGGIARVALFEDEGHAQEAFPEIDRTLPVGAQKRHVVQALDLDFANVFCRVHDPFPRYSTGSI